MASLFSRLSRPPRTGAGLVLALSLSLSLSLSTRAALAQSSPAPLPPLAGPGASPPVNAQPPKALPPLPDSPAPLSPSPQPTGVVQDVTILPPLPPAAPEPSPSSVPLVTPGATPPPPHGAPPGGAWVVGPAPEPLGPPEVLKPHGWSFGLRFDFGFPIGSERSFSGGTDLSGGTTGGFGDHFGVLFAFTGDAGYRLTPHWYLGGYFSAGFSLSASQCAGSTQCSLNDLRFGVEAKYSGAPAAFVNPWIGAGLGWEIANESTDSGAGASYGPEFFHLRTGLEFRVNPHLYVGPEAMFTLGAFVNGLGAATSTAVGRSLAVHDWLSLGVGGHFDL
jgi:hypothetical protein